MSFAVTSTSSRLFRPLFRLSVSVKRFTAITSASFFSSNSANMDAPLVQPVQRILITGGTDGIGRRAVLHFATDPNYIVTFTGRSNEKADEVIAKCQEIAITNNTPNLPPPVFRQYDFSVDVDVVRFADQAAAEKFDICVINHGVMHPNEKRTINNRNSTMMPNLISSYMIAHRIIEGRETPDRRIHFVFTTSMLITIYPWRWFLSLFNIFNPKKTEDWTKVCENTTSSGWNEYMASKMGMVTLASTITNDATLQNVTATAVHPGIVFTSLMSTLSNGRQSRARCLIGCFGTSLRKAGENVIRAATYPLAELGRYYHRHRPHTLPQNDYCQETLTAFNTAMEQLSQDIRNGVNNPQP